MQYKWIYCVSNILPDHTFIHFNQKIKPNTSPKKLTNLASDKILIKNRAKYL